MAQLKDLIVNGASRFIGDIFGNKAQLTTLDAPETAGGSTYGPGTSGQVLKTNGTSIYWGADNNSGGTVTSVRVQATSPVVSSVNTAQTGTLNTTISLADGYGDTKNPYASKTKNYVLAAPSNANGAPSFRALVAADIPDLDTYLKKSGGTMTGALTLSGAPTADLHAATKKYVDDAFAANDAMIFKGTISGGSTDNYGALTGAANRGWTYKVDTAGKINGVAVEIGDILICLDDNTAAATSSDYATAQTHWVIVQNNVDGAVFKSSNSFTDGKVIIADGTNGKVKTSSYSLGATINSGTANQIAYYSGANTIDSMAPAWQPWTAGSTNGPQANIQIGNAVYQSAAIPNATATNSGIVTTGAQTFAGDKTFQGNIFPAVSDSYNLGSTALRWKFLYGVRGIDLTNAGATGITVNNTDIVHSSSYKVDAAGLAGIYDDFHAFWVLSTDQPYGDTWLKSKADRNIIFERNGTENARFDTTGHFIPGTTETFNLGSTTKYWNNAYIKNIIYSSGEANRLVWTDSDKLLKATNHYADATSIAINSTTIPTPPTGYPTYNLYINGDARSSGDLYFEGTNNKLAAFKLTTVGTVSRANIDMGWDWEKLDGAGAAFRSTDPNLAANQIGRFVLFARTTADDTTQLVGAPTGELSWKKVSGAARMGINADANANYNLYVNGTSLFTNAVRIQYGGKPASLYLYDNSNDTSTHSIIRLGAATNENGAYIWLNGPSRTADGGANTLSIRNNVGYIRLNNVVHVGTESKKGGLRVYGAFNYTATGETFDTNDRPSLTISGNYPQIWLMSNANNTSHGATITLGGMATADATSGDMSAFTIESSGAYAPTNLTIGYGTNANPHYNTGISSGYGTLIMRLTSAGRVGILTASPSYPLHVTGDIYSSGWIRAASGFYCHDTGVHYTHNGNHGEINITKSNEMIISGNANTLYINYRAATRGTLVTTFRFHGGSSTSYSQLVTGHIIPGADNTYTLGSTSSLAWSYVCARNHTLYAGSAWYGDFQINRVGTANSGDGNATRGAQGVTLLRVGNNVAWPAAGTAGGANNSTGIVRIYAENTYFTDIMSQAGSANRTFYLPNYNAVMYAVHAGNNNAVGSATQPVYVAANGRVTACTAYGSGAAGYLSLPRVTQDYNTLPGNNLTMIKEYNSSSANRPTNHWYHAITSNGADSNYATQFAMGMTITRLYYRNYSGSWSAWKQVWIAGDSVTSAVWNDYAEYRETDTMEAGRCVIEVGDDSMTLSTKRLQRGCSITSDTWGFAQGETEKAKTPIAVSGRVLAYPYESREEFASHIGWPVCSGPNGTVSIMTEEEEEKYPSRIIGTISAIPNYEEWGGGENADRPPVKVNGRVWIRIR